MTDTTTDETPYVSALTLGEMSDTLTGYEEVAIATRFGEDALTLMRFKPTMFGRAMVFAHIGRQDGVKQTAAYEQSMSMTIRQVDDYFRAEADAPEVIDGEVLEGDGPDVLGLDDSDTGKGAEPSTS